MKRTLIILLGCAALALPVSALEKRTFKSADETKSFEAVLTDYNPKNGTITVRKVGGRTSTFKLALLCDEDQAYVKENAKALIAAKAIRLDFDLYKDKSTKVKSETSRTTTTPAGYEIEARNWTDKDIEDVEIDYTIFHRKDAENGPGSITQTTGSIQITMLFKNSADTNRTDPINLVRYSREASGGG